MSDVTHWAVQGGIVQPVAIRLGTCRVSLVPWGCMRGGDGCPVGGEIAFVVLETAVGVCARL